MKIHYLFSRNKKIGSKIISWAAKFENTGLEQLPSHVAILMNDSWVIESTFASGVRVVPYFKWKQINEELYKIPCVQDYRSSEEVMQLALDLWGKKYDWLGILYFSVCYIKLIVKKIPLPTINKWQSKDRYFCTEYAATLSGEDFSMKSPARICADWLQEEK